LDIEALRSFIAFVDTGSFTRAAKQTFRTQGAISMQMKKLEEEAGQQLFEKKGSNLQLTEHGRTLTSYARRILAMHDEALSQLVSTTPHPPLRIGCPDDYAQSVLPVVIEQLRALQPALNYVVRCDCSTELRRWLDSGQIDVAILTRSGERDEGYLLHHDRGVWVHGGFPELFDAPELPLVLYEADCKFHSTAIDGLEKSQRPHRLLCATSSATTICALLRKGLGISAMARSSMGAGLVEFNGDTGLPALPAADIVLQLAPTPHPLLNAAGALELSESVRAVLDL